MGKPADLLPDFPSDTLFYDVGGTPVAVREGLARAFDGGVSRPFPAEEVRRAGKLVSEGIFASLVDSGGKPVDLLTMPFRDFVEYLSRELVSNLKRNADRGTLTS